MRIIITENQFKLLLENKSLVDSILDKINRDGISSLTSDEKNYLKQLKNDEVDKGLEKWLLDDSDNTFDDEGNKLQYDEFDDDEYLFNNKGKLKRIITNFLGEPFTNNSDWGGYFVWAIGDNELEGLFLIINNDDETVELIDRKVIDDYDDDILMSAINGRQFYKIIMKIKNATT
jgi:hypothetical protein